MNKFNLIIYQNQYLFEILKEIKLDSQYQITYVENNIDEIILNIKKENKEFLVISNKIQKKFEKKYMLLITKPLKILDLIEKISLSFLKNKYSTTSHISVGKYIIDLNSRKISLNGVDLKLTEKEIELIMYLYQHKLEKKSSDIRKDVWGHSENVETHTVETHIYRLRKKIIDKFRDNNFIIYDKNGYKIL